MKRINIFILVLIILNVSCEDSSDVQITPLASPIPYIKITNDLNSSDIKRHQTDIDSAWVMFDTLYLIINYSSCGGDTMDVFASSYFAESNPPQTEVVLSRNSISDMCDMYFTDTLRFNISPLRFLYKQLYSRPRGTLLLNIYEPQATQVTIPRIIYHF